MDVFALRDHLVRDYEDYTRSFLEVSDPRIKERVESELSEGLLWPEPLIQLNPSFESAGTIDDLVLKGLLHEQCGGIFRRNKDTMPGGLPMRLHRHQVDAIEAAQRGENYVLTTGTGSGKSLAYMVPIVDSVLREPGPGIKAIVVYPMNALANSQRQELEKFLVAGQRGDPLVSFHRYTGQEDEEAREAILQNPPDILLTNYVMLELMLTRPKERRLLDAATSLRFLVLDELHTYRGRQGADVSLLVRRVRETTGSARLRYVGTSATLAGTTGNRDQQRAEVAAVASRMFGVEVAVSGVIGETLRRTTRTPQPEDPAWLSALKDRVAGRGPTPDAVGFSADPLASWVEAEFGLTAVEDGALVRSKPRPIGGEEGAAASLAKITGLDRDACDRTIRATLQLGFGLKDPETGFPLFAFRLHQFFSRGDAVYSSLADAKDRFITTQAQQLDPSDESRTGVLLPLAFCRECGQEYYVVERPMDSPDTAFQPRTLSDTSKDERLEKGFLVVDSGKAWPDDATEVLDLLPEDWLEESKSGVPRLKSSFKDKVPERVRLGRDGRKGDPDGVLAVYLPAPLRFCVSCGVTYAGNQASDLGKLNSLGSGGRSSATSLLSLTAVRQLRADPDLPKHAQKLLAFTDNRQDASLQAGHFNDFVQVGLLRSALHRAAFDAADEGGLRHELLTAKVTEALGLPIEHYAQDPDVQYLARAETDRALRDLVGYRLYRDLQRGWRVTAPNLEQTGLLEIRYESLPELSADEAVWAKLHPALAQASADDRFGIAKVLLDLLRRSLAIQVEYLDDVWQTQLKLRSSQHLIQPWAIDEEEKMETAGRAFPRAVTPNDFQGNRYVSGRSGMGQLVGRTLTPPGSKLRVDEREQVIRDLFEGLRVAGLVGVVEEPKSGGVAGYQLKAGAMRWVGHPPTEPVPFHDPTRVPRPPKSGHKANPFFLRFYTETAGSIAGIEAREHTAQVPAADRIDREDRFRTGALPILYCSPTMELGVDIAELNVVGLRNVPPTPANYAQRSGRAGRSGSPALVFNYCAWGSPHDQYFFRRPEQMVGGQVRPPRLDLANEDLIRSHVHALWLAEIGLDLKSSLADLLDLDGDPPALALSDSVHAAINNDVARRRAGEKAQRMLVSVPEIETADWYSNEWLDETLRAAPLRFDDVCDRWRDLYQSAWSNRAAQHKLVGTPSLSAADRGRAQVLRDQAEAQIKLLTGESDESRMQSDFYSYRYFASEGFLPGYSFPRLPLSAWIPGRRGRSGRNDYLSRPRFLAISEFGPRSIVYHEGSRYRITQVLLPAERMEGNKLQTERMKRCDVCAYLHHMQGIEPGPDLCENCDAPLPNATEKLFRLRNVVTKRQDRITSDEEERQRLGFEIWTSIRFATPEGVPSSREAEIKSGEATLATATYAPTATIWRINVGWRRRGNPAKLGFVLDTNRGYWGRSNEDPTDKDDQMSESKEMVIPYVEDTRNVLLLTPKHPLGPEELASIGAAMKTAIQTEFQLEDMELAIEPLPSEHDRRVLLLYESAEGGAGILRRLANEPSALATVGRRALEICHFDPATGLDQKHAPGAKDDCAAACYDCLMSYGNQRDHRLLDRFKIKDWLMALAQGRLETTSSYQPRDEHLATLKRAAESTLEEAWLDAVSDGGYLLPSRAQHYLEGAIARPDFLYEDKFVAIYVDGPVHDHDDVKERDDAAQGRLEDAGYYVLRFDADSRSWRTIFDANPGVFGKSQ